MTKKCRNCPGPSRHGLTLCQACSDVATERAIRWAAENRARSRANKKAWRDANHEKARASERAYFDRNIGARKAASAAWARANAAKKRASVRLWAQKNPGAGTARRQRRKARLLGSGGPGVTPEAWREIVELAGGACAFVEDPIGP